MCYIKSGSLNIRPSGPNRSIVIGQSLAIDTNLTTDSLTRRTITYDRTVLEGYKVFRWACRRGQNHCPVDILRWRGTLRPLLPHAKIHCISSTPVGEINHCASVASLLRSHWIWKEWSWGEGVGEGVFSWHCVWMVVQGINLSAGWFCRAFCSDTWLVLHADGPLDCLVRQTSVQEFGV